jgi:hypothetical protein
MCGNATGNTRYYGASGTSAMPVAITQIVALQKAAIG